MTAAEVGPLVAHHVPAALTVRSRKPRGDERCRVCQLTYAEHTGDLCAICRRPVEHHLDADEMRVEIEGCARLALAYDDPSRVRVFEEWCIHQVELGAVA